MIFAAPPTGAWYQIKIAHIIGRQVAVSLPWYSWSLCLVVASIFLEGIHYIIPTVGPAVSFSFRVDHKVLEAVVEKTGPSLVHLHPPGPVDAPPEHASDRCRLCSVTGAVLVCFCLLYTSPSPRDVEESRMPSSA